MLRYIIIRRKLKKPRGSMSAFERCLNIVGCCGSMVMISLTIGTGYPGYAAIFAFSALGTAYAAICG